MFDVNMLHGDTDYDPEIGAEPMRGMLSRMYRASGIYRQNAPDGTESGKEAVE